MTSTRMSRGAWQRLVTEWQRSGLSCAEFAQRRSVSARTLAWWRWRLARKVDPVAGVDSVSASTFIELRARREEPGPIEIVLDNRRVVRVMGPVDEDVLARVLLIAEAASS